ncbi:hypothetical protein [Nocardioides kribbensis]|uniref:hypothetical protein n=1 Tax=Nocardioides kribbensis TaxID=305517 RepID=UPI0032E8792D
MDVTRPERAPHALLNDPFVAQAWLAGVYGSEVARVVERFLEEPETAEPVTLTARRDVLSDVVGRLGVGFWLHRWWPAGAAAIPEIDARILELEIGADAWSAEAVFVATEPITALLEPHTELLATQVEAVRTAAGRIAELDLGVLETALRATVDLVDDTTPGYDACASLLTAIETENRAVAEAVAGVQWDSVVADLWDEFADTLAASRPELALASKGPGPAGDTVEVVRRGVATVDELQVGPRAVASRPGNVNWSLGVDGDDGALLTVRVDAAPDHPPGSPLLARVYLNAVPEVFSLWYDADWRAFVGTHRLSAVPDSDPRIDIFDPAYALRPRLSEQAREQVAADRRRREEIILARRDTARLFIAERAAWDDADD